MFGFPSRSNDPAPRFGPRIEQLEDRTVPALFAIGDTYSTPVSQVLTVPANQGVLSNDFSDTFPGSVMTAQLLSTAKYVSGPTTPVGQQLPPLPAGSLLLNPDGSFTFIAPNPSLIPTGVTQVEFFYLASNTDGEITVLPGRVVINLQGQARNYIAVGADAGGGPHVRVYVAGSSQLAFNFFPYEPSFTGGVRVAVGDLTGDGIDDIATIPAFGGGPRVRVFSGKDGAPVVDTFAFDSAFRGGGFVSIGDFTGDGVGDLIVAAGEGGGSRVQVFQVGVAGPSAGQIQIVADFFAFNPFDRQGVRLAAGDLDGDGDDEIVAALGPGGAPNVRVFDGATSIGLATVNPTLSFFVADGASRDGLFVATGDLRGDGLHDIIVGGGSGGNVVRVYDGRNAGLIRQFSVPTEETPTGGGVSTNPFFNGPGSGTLQTGILLNPGLAPGALVPSLGGSAGLVDPLFANIRGGVRVAATDWDGDGLDDIVTGAGPGSAPRVRVFDAASATEIASILAFSPTFLGGINVAGSTG
ncbi:MAG TPA: hypothetical protein VFG68_21935 [Fimbriiglobus sp.]|nr:hypothetical protein [Fimbriiglobus sp.]